MYLNIQMNDQVYQQLVAEGKRVRGSIALVSPTEGNFHAHKRSATERVDSKWIKLAHGRASVSEEQVTLTLRIDTQESGINPSEAITDESRMASDFVEVILSDY